MKKIIAFHLPQYHRIPENDVWWGDGFTDWDNVKKARPLFKGHQQPKVPLHNNYYDMTSVDVIKRQAEICKKYGIAGFCYYHYWFNGKKLLEKPIELLLKERSIDQKYCLCWANEPWTRSWDGLSGIEIMPQEYGGIEEWEKHFLYLLPFFCDERYIKVESKPVFVIYRTESIEHFDDMVAYFNKRAIQEGIPGLFILEERNSFQDHKISNMTNGIIEFEPLFTIRSKRQKIIDRIIRLYRNKRENNKLLYYDYKMIWKHIISKCNTKKMTYDCAFVGWDNTARRGKEGAVITNASVELFYKYFRLLYKKTDKDILFINAWNEWAEGCYLEADSLHEYKYLEAIKKVIDEDVCNGKDEKNKGNT